MNKQIMQQKILKLYFVAQNDITGSREMNLTTYNRQFQSGASFL